MTCHCIACGRALPWGRPRLLLLSGEFVCDQDCAQQGGGSRQLSLYPRPEADHQEVRS